MSGGHGPRVLITRVTDLDEGLDRVFTAGLYVPDTELSDIVEFLEQGALDAQGYCQTNPTRQVLGLWLARTVMVPDAPVGMALVTAERDAVYGRHHRLNLVVTSAWRHHGIGTALIAAAQAFQPVLAGHYNPQSIALYERCGVTDVVSLRHPDEPARARERHQRLHAERNRLAAVGHTPRPHGP
jgi:GNAT superfamily N-acetyltransferase